MAENKKKVVVYTDWLKNFEDLTDVELGKLMRHFFMYINDENPILEDRLLKIAWKPIEVTLKRDLKKWESYIDKQKDNGSKGGRPKKETQKTQAFIKEPKKAVSDSVSVNDSVIDKINDVYKRFKDEVKESRHQQAIDMMYANLKLKKGSLTPLLKEFHGQIIIDEKLHKSTTEFKTHFYAWLNKKESLGKLNGYKLKT